MPEANHGIRSKITKKLFINLLCTAVLTRFASSAVAVIDGLLTSRFLGTANMAANGIAAAYFLLYLSSPRGWSQGVRICV